MKLKTIISGTVPILAIVMAGCTANEDIAVAEKGNNAIRFNVVTPNMTRAANSYCNNNKPEKFKVTAFDAETKENYFKGNIDIVTGDETKTIWTSDHDRYWPEDKPDTWKGLTFFAYVDGDVLDESDHKYGELVLPTAESETFAPQIKNFKVNTDVSQQQDLLYSTRHELKPGGGVNLLFRHALSQICFTGQNNNPLYSNIRITEIEIGGLYGTGTLTFAEKGFGGYATSEHPNTQYQYGDNSYMGNWSDYSMANEPYVLDNLNISLGTPNTDTKKGEIINISKPSNEEHSNVTDYSKAMNLLPQTMNRRENEEATSGAYLKVTIYLTPIDESEKSEPKTCFIPLDVNWKEGCRYNYNLVWEGNKMIYAVSVFDYNDVEKNDASTSETPVYTKVKMRNSPELYFADRNIGATSVDDSGLFFWWGDTKGYRQNLTGTAWINNEGETISFSTGDPIANQTYNLYYNKELFSKGWTVSEDAGSSLTFNKDAARQKMKKDWRMPTTEEQCWLCSTRNCEWQWCDGQSGTITFETTTFGEKSVDKFKTPGAFVLSKETGNIIFLPACGYGLDNYLYIHDSYYTQYWSATDEGDENTHSYAFSLSLCCDEAGNNFADTSDNDCNDRYYGYPIRAVADSNQ